MPFPKWAGAMTGRLAKRASTISTLFIDTDTSSTWVKRVGRPGVSEYGANVLRPVD